MDLREMVETRRGFGKKALEAYYCHVRDNCGGWTYFASVHTAKSGWEHELAFHRALIAQPSGAQ